MNVFGFGHVPMQRVYEEPQCFTCGYDITGAIAVVRFEKVGLQTVCTKCKTKHKLQLNGVNELIA